MYYIGIDGGGSYSRMAAVNEDLSIIGKHAGSAANFDRFGYDGVKNNISKLLREFNKLTNTRISECKAICICGADLYGTKYAKWIEKALQETELLCPIKVISDKAAMIAAETKGRPGIGVIAGISASSFAIDGRGGFHQAGDYKCILGDGGSSYKIGLDAVRAALLSADGIIPYTLLTDKIKEYYKLLDIREVSGHMDAGTLDKSRTAELSFTVKYAAQQGDRASIEIEYAASRDLFLLTKAMLERLALPAPTIVLCGSMLLTNENIRDRYIQLLHKDYPQARTLPQTEKPETGAAYLAAAASE